MDPMGDGPARGWIGFDAFVTKAGPIEVLIAECNPRETAITGATRMLGYLILSGRLPAEACIATTMLKTRAVSWQGAYEGMNGHAFTRDTPVGGLVVNPGMIKPYGKFFLVVVGENPRDADERRTALKAMLAAA